MREAIEGIQAEIGSAKAISALSGGVDSCVVTALGHKALGNRLEVIFIDDGLMRQDEGKDVKAAFGKMGIKVQVVNARKRFFDALKGLLDPEDKRKAFRHTFYQVFGEAVAKSGASFLLQGTIAPDVIETKGKVKSQHNVLDQVGISAKDTYGFHAVEPIKTLYKPGVRQVARALGLPKAYSERMPFPGPGLMTRCVGEATPRRIEIVRRACKIAEEETPKYKPFQAFGVLLADKATGLTKTGKRHYGDIVVVRCIQSKDAMTATPTKLSWPVLERIRERILKACPTVVKVLLDVTGKPPSTIEYI